MTYSMRRDGLLSDCAERDIQNGVLAPVLVIVMPPLVRLDRKPLRFHHRAQQIAAGALLGRAAGIIRIGTLGHLVIIARHLHRLAGFQFVHRQVHRGAAIVLRAALRIGDEFTLLARRHVPEQLGDGPRAIAVVDEETVAVRGQGAMRAHHRLGRRPLQKRARLLVDWLAEKVVGARVADVELDRRIELHELDEIRASRSRRIDRRALSERQQACSACCRESNGRLVLYENDRRKERRCEDQPHYGSFTGRPLTNTCLIAVFSSNKSPSVTMTFAIFPCSSDPRRSLAPASVAAFRVSALIAASFDKPLATVFCAFFRKSFGSESPLDSNANSTPALSSSAGPFGALARSRSTLSASSASGASDGRRVGKLRL